eukprot:TRINITY_DN75847_c0_g1_i1.p1 TRINITY_DN75847_c0_g1~~TRINITY_DN75847_c0_g1_i1.p1  ORF type:complete len:384 (-),score=66.78 TRINITY_DN75847_c0_g1_i1:71-1192(-)
MEIVPVPYKDSSNSSFRTCLCADAWSSFLPRLKVQAHIWQSACKTALCAVAVCQAHRARQGHRRYPASKRARCSPRAASPCPEDQPEISALEIWRAIPAEEPTTYLGAMGAEYDRHILHRSLPTRSLAVLFLEAEELPCVGHEVQVRLSTSVDRATRIAAIEYAMTHDNALMACLPDIENAIGLPKGGTIAELMDLIRSDTGEVIVRMRGLAALRLVDKSPAKQQEGFMVALFQEVPEFAVEESSAELEDCLEEVASLEKLFADCGELQKLSGLSAAGDFFSQSLAERTDAVLSTLSGIRMLGSKGTEELGPNGRRAAAAVHATIGAFSPSMRVGFHCAPKPLRRRLHEAKGFLLKVQSMLCARVAFKRAFDQ